MTGKKIFSTERVKMYAYRWRDFKALTTGAAKEEQLMFRKQGQRYDFDEE